MYETFIAKSSAVALGLFVMLAMVLMFWIGWKIKKRWRVDKLEPKGGMVTVQSALLGFFGFILAFTFSMSGNRYDYMRSVFIDESNAIGTAVLRSDLYPDSARAVFRSNFKEYVEARIGLYNDPYDTAKINAAKKRLSALSKSLWNLAMRQSKKPDMFLASQQMVPALNEMFDTGSKRDILLRTSIPDIIVYMMLILSLLISFTGGLVSVGEIDRRDLVIIICFVIFTGLIIYITLDLGRPLRGIIRASAAEQSIRDLRLLFQP